jgi:hypothetical protein
MFKEHETLGLLQDFSVKPNIFKRSEIKPEPRREPEEFRKIRASGGYVIGVLVYQTGYVSVIQIGRYPPP